MKKLLFGAILLALAAGCAITDYPVITDARGSYVGVIRTGHKAYIIPSGQVATIWSDGSDELFTMVYQNQYGDQMLHTQNNFDPSGAVYFLDQTYCDWQYTGCEAVTAWNPANDFMDDVFDYTWFMDCSGARSLSVLVSYGSRYMGECGDAGFMKDRQAAMGEFANLATTSWRGKTAYIIPVNGSNTTVSLNGVGMPIYGQITSLMTDRFQIAVPMTPNFRSELRWLLSFASENGRTVTASINYNSLSVETRLSLVPAGLSYNLNRF